jgi:hypothetical protein
VTIRVAIRGFAGRHRKVFEDRLDVDTEEMDWLLSKLAKEHGEKLASHELHMIEMEFLDEANPLERFFRFGTDPTGMVMPMRIKLEKPN